MALTIPPFNSLSDSELLATVRRLVTDERMATATLIASLAELDGRRLYLGEGCSSLFTYCTGVLHLSEHAAYARIEAARVARRFPVVLERLAEGAVTLTAVGLLAPHLTPDNHQALLEAARHKSKREVQELVARIRPKADVPATVRKLPVPVSTCTAAAPRGDGLMPRAERVDESGCVNVSCSASTAESVDTAALPGALQGSVHPE